MDCSQLIPSQTIGNSFLILRCLKLIKVKRCKNKCKVLPNNLWLQTSHNKSYNYDKLHIIISSVDSNSRNKCLKDLWENWEHNYTGVHESLNKFSKVNFSLDINRQKKNQYLSLLNWKQKQSIRRSGKKFKKVIPQSLSNKTC